MAKTQKYAEDLLLDAVVKYAAQYRGKIEATKLAKWASEYIDGLEGVEDRHFMRPMQKTDPKTGKTVKKTKLCTAKINEINASRSTIAAVNTNVLLKASNIDKFFSLKIHEQRVLILETRSLFDRLVAENAYLRNENSAMKNAAVAVSEKIDELESKICELHGDQEKLLMLVSRALKTFDEGERRKMLASIGVCDGLFDLDAYVDSLSIKLSDAFSINEAVQRFRPVKPKDPQSCENHNLMDGIEF